ncbi:MAG: ATP-binding cassette domain-containing protein [Candidatus Syntrophonatronum acetioxidans]|uniref:ATP-binding cassette domain-containing protein n=1 Tax=Candidatus Syntrophonatronum acetioxidans TaxID=1795816 RepID=A0A424YFG1_9FIRM|nr:MAG: ATP-binding cassette domain-containing protein [Candidatus Syntrophonatronum acetioxidans]
MEMAIEVKDLVKYYGKFLALENISFNVKKGEIFGFLGPNGAGKTTTQKILTGILKPSGGKVSILGYDIEKNPLDAKKFTGIVPDETNAYIELNAWDNLTLMGNLYGMPGKKLEERAEDLLKMFELYQRRKDRVKGFSRGMKRRLLLAMGLIHEPDILFLDEPVSGLDVQSARLMRKVIMDLNQKGITIFLTTHNIEEANQMCHRVAIICKGKIAAIDRPESLKKTIKGTQSLEVAFDKPLENLVELKEIPGVEEVKTFGDKVRLFTSDPGHVIKPLVQYSQDKKLNFISLNTLGPSLEEVFVNLTEERRQDTHGKE